MEIKISDEKLIVMNRALLALGNFKNKSFAYARNRNLKKIRLLLYTLDKRIQPSKDFVDYDNKRVKLCETYSLDDKGVVCTKENGNFDIQDNDAFDKEHALLEKKYKKYIDERRVQVDDYYVDLKKEKTVELFGVKEEFIPDTITGTEFDSIEPLIIFKEDTNTEKISKDGKVLELVK